MGLRRAAYYLGPVLLLVLVLGDVAYAEDADAADDLMSAFKAAAEQWIDPLQVIATWLLISLATISLAWRFGLLVLQQADFQEFVVELVRIILFAGFFLALVQNADVWSKALISGFMWLANHVTGYSSGSFDVDAMTPASIFQRGMNLAVTLTETSGTWREMFVYWISALLVVVFYALIAAFVLLVFCETYFVSAAGVILLGFGGNPWTNDYAMRYLTYCLSVGMKLFVTLLIVGLGEQLIYHWALNSGAGDARGVLAIVGVLLLLAVLVWMLPNIIQAVVNGSSLNSGAGAFGAVAGMAAGTAAGATAVAAGGIKAMAAGVSAVTDAAKLAHSQVTSGSAGAKLAQMAQYADPGMVGADLLAHTAGNLAKGAASAVGDWAKGRSGGGALPEVAAAVHAARKESEKALALQEAGGGSGLGSLASGLGSLASGLGSAASGLGSAASGSASSGSDSAPDVPDKNPFATYDSEVRSMAAEDQKDHYESDPFKALMEDTKTIREET